MHGPFSFLIFLSAFAVAAPVEIPFRMQRGLILVEANIEGSAKPLNLILDSGAGATVLSKQVAAESSLLLTPGERIRTVHGLENANRAARTHLRLGTSPASFRFPTHPLIVDLKQESRALGARLDGLLGSDFFAGRLVRIDFKRSRLHLSPDERPGPDAIQLPLTRSADGIFLRLTAAGSPLARVRLDTGCCRSLCWTPPAPSGFFRNGKTTRIDVKLGWLIMPSVPTDVYRRPLFPNEDGLLGTALLARFDSVWIDSIRNRIAFEGTGKQSGD